MLRPEIGRLVAFDELPHGGGHLRTAIRRQIGLNLGGTLARAWLVGGAILAVGLAGQRADGLTAAVLVFVAFTAYFALSVILHTVARGSR